MRRPSLLTLTILSFASMCVGKAAPSQTPKNLALIAAIITVESNGNDAAVGDNGKAVGPLQIHPQMVEDVNRILGKEVYTLESRKSRAESIAIFSVFTNHYTPSWSPELVARRWNGGPRGDKKASTEKYWRKVQRALK